MVIFHKDIDNQNCVFIFSVSIISSRGDFDTVARCDILTGVCTSININYNQSIFYYLIYGNKSLSFF